MTTFVLGSESTPTSAALCDYLDERVGPDDVVHVVNSLPGGDRTERQEIRDGESALNVVAVRLGEPTVETHQFIRGNDPAEDLLTCAAQVGADELVVGVGRRDPSLELNVGTTARGVLLGADVPVVVVPLRRE